MTRPPQRSTSGLVAGLMVALVVYASLYPLTGWRLPQGLAWSDWFWLPSAPLRGGSDQWLNVLGYVPVGACLAVAALRRSWPSGWAAILGWLLAALLSYVMELTQTLLPSRVPSRQDWWDNAGGALLGAGLAWALHRGGVLEALARWRDRWFASETAFGQALLLIWPAALLAPSPLPFGMGQMWDAVLRALLSVLGQWASTGWGWGWDLSTMTAVAAPLSPAHQVVAMTLGLLAPGLLASAVTAPGWRRLLLLVGLLPLGTAAVALSAMLHFGPAHALAWWTPQVGLSLTVAAGLHTVAAWLPRRLAAVLGLVALAFWVALVGQAPTDAYQTAALQAWEQGRFIRFHGLSAWLSWIWPYAALLWLIGQLANAPREPR